MAYPVGYPYSDEQALYGDPMLPGLVEVSIRITFFVLAF